jgi:hypothetical protein
MRATLFCIIGIIFAICEFNSGTPLQASPVPQNRCPDVAISSGIVVVNNTCGQPLDIRVATPAKTADGVVGAGSTWNTGLAVDATRSYKFWSCPSLLYPTDTSTSAAPTYGSKTVLCKSK